MPELPEVEVVRSGLANWVINKTISSVEVLHPRAIRHHFAGENDFISQLTSKKINSVNRRGKYMWLELSDGLAVVTHLGMSGQVLIHKSSNDADKHLRIRFRFTNPKNEMHFVDQRTFGGMQITELVDVGDGELIPESVTHIARDPFDSLFDHQSAISKLLMKKTEVKRALLDQTLVSGIGNIYADESLWRAKLHWSYPANKLSRVKASELLTHATDVMREALAQGGTSFDSLYVNVNGESGYFARGLSAYGREDEPCDRCGCLIVRDAFMNRSSFRCPKCQPKPRVGK
jgi:formamidopyrimidine-DNA glycosylase